MATTAVKFGGLLVVLGFFGMGPGTLLVDEIRAKYQHAQKKKRDEHDDHSDEEHGHKNHLGIDAANKRRNSYPISPHNHTDDVDLQALVKHPFQLAVTELPGDQHPSGGKLSASPASGSDQPKRKTPSPKKITVSDHGPSTWRSPYHYGQSSDLFSTPPRYCMNATPPWATAAFSSTNSRPSTSSE